VSWKREIKGRENEFIQAGLGGGSQRGFRERRINLEGASLERKRIIESKRRDTPSKKKKKKKIQRRKKSISVPGIKLKIQLSREILKTYQRGCFSLPEKSCEQAH